MHTSAHPSADAHEQRFKVSGTVVQPIEVRLLQDGGHALCVTLSTGSRNGGVKAQVPIAPGEQALKEAHALAKRVNAAAKQGRSQLTLSAPLSQATLRLAHASIDAHQEPDAAQAHEASHPPRDKPPRPASAPAASFKSLAANDVQETQNQAAEPALF